MKLRSILAVALAATFVASFSSPRAYAGQSGDPNSDANYDRLDGTGTSGEKVQVIEWEGNLEIHVYPKGSTAGIGLKLDNTNKNRPVMVIAYRFANNPRQKLIRRNILGITLVDGFKVYKDPMENDFDKFIVSNNGLSGDLLAYKLDPPPTQLYPDGANPQGNSMLANGSQGGNNNRAPASVGGTPAGSSGYGYSNPNTPPPQVDDAGAIQPFFMNQGGRGGR